MKKKNKVDGLRIDIDGESLCIYIDNGDFSDPTHVCYWHIDEVKEDPEVCISMLRAVQLFYTNPKELVDVLDKSKND